MGRLRLSLQRVSASFGSMFKLTLSLFLAFVFVILTESSGADNNEVIKLDSHLSDHISRVKREAAKKCNGKKCRKGKGKKGRKKAGNRKAGKGKKGKRKAGKGKKGKRKAGKGKKGKRKAGKGNAGKGKADKKKEKQD